MLSFIRLGGAPDMTQAIQPFYHVSSSQPGLARRLFDSVGADYMPHRTRSETIAHHGVHALRQTGEAVIVGGLLGALHAAGHLDAGPSGKVPVDLAVAGVGLAYALMKSHDEMATDARNIGSLALGIYSFRHVDSFIGTKRLAAGESRGVTKSLAAHGDDAFGLSAGEDPIVSFAKTL